MRTTSGRSRRTSRHRLGAVARRADHGRGRARRRGSSAGRSRTSSTSSTTSTRIVTPAPRPPPAGRAPGSRRRAAARLHRAAVERGPLASCRPARARRPAAAARRRRPSSQTSTSRAAGAAATRDPRRRRAGVLEHVGQRLLHDPVGGEVDARRAGAGRRRSPPTSTGTPAARTRASRSSSSRRLGCGATEPSSAVGEQVQQPAHLGQPLPAGRLDGAERAAGGVRVARRRSAGPPAPG